MSVQQNIQHRSAILRRLRRAGKARRAALMNPYQSLFYDVANFLMRIAFRLLVNLEIVGLENVPLQGRLIIIGNHTGWPDPVLVGSFIPRRIVFMAKKELTRNPLAAFIIWSYGVFSVDRGNVDRVALKRTDEIMASEGALCMFPEGTRSRSGEMRRAKAGTTLVAIRHNAPILPISISGAHHGIFTPLLHGRRPRIRMVIGKPFMLPPVNGEVISKDVLARLTDEMMMHVAENLPEEQRGYYRQPA